MLWASFCANSVLLCHHVLIILEFEDLRTKSVHDPPLMWDGHCFSLSQAQPSVPLLRSILSAMVKPYLMKNPTAVAALDLIRKHDGGPLCYDHFAFRTFGVSQGPSSLMYFTIHTNTPFSSHAKQDFRVLGWVVDNFMNKLQVNGCGIDAMSQVFLDLGYTVRDELRFPSKKLRALWFSPPDHLLDMEGSEADGPLPRIFISEINVHELSSESQVGVLQFWLLDWIWNCLIHLPNYKDCDFKFWIRVGAKVIGGQSEDSLSL